MIPRVLPFLVSLPGAARRLGFAAAIALGAAAPACAESGPRPLVLADGSAPAHEAAIAARVASFQAASRRQVRVIRTDQPAEAVKLAARGDVDVAVVDASHALGDFVAADHGREAGTLVLDPQSPGATTLRVLEVNAVAHPKVDAEGARALAAALLSPPP